MLFPVADGDEEYRLLKKDKTLQFLWTFMFLEAQRTNPYEAKWTVSPSVVQHLDLSIKVSYGLSLNVIHFKIYQITILESLQELR